MERVQFRRHNGSQILHIDLSKARPDASLEAIDQARQLIALQPPQSVLTLTDVSDIIFNRQSTEALKQLSIHNKPYVKAAALVGVEGLKKIIYQAIVTATGRKFRLFDDVEAASEWLAQEG